MIIKSVTLLNFGLYLGQHSIHFPLEQEKNHVTLIGGLNGRGKTTFLDAIILGLYGKRALPHLQNEKIKYSQYLLNHINKSADPAQASITLVLSGLGQYAGELTIQRSWGLDAKGNIDEQFIAIQNGKKDSYLSENWDYFVEEILPLNISRFFFFDSEKIAQIADDETFESVKDSIKSLLGLTTIDQLIDDMGKLIRSTYAERKQTQNGEAAQKQQQVEEQFAAAQKELEELVQECAHIRVCQSSAQKRYNECEKDFWAKGGKLGLQKEALISKLDQLKKNVSTAKEKVFEIVENAYAPLLCCRTLLHNTYNYLSEKENQKAAIYANQIIDQMAALLSTDKYAPDFVCNAQKFFEIAKKELTAQAASSSNNNSVSAAAYSLLQRFVMEAQKQIDEIDALQSHIRDLEAEIDQIDILLSFEASENDVRALWNQMKELTATLLQYETQRKAKEERQAQIVNQLEILKRRRETFDKERMQTIQDQDESLRIIHYATMTERVMGEFKKRIQLRRSLELQRRIYECFSFMAQKDSIVQRIEIDPETLNIRLVDYNGNELLKDQLSAGEKQLFAVSILWGLAQSSGYDMPVIVDTPLGRLDSHHRTNFVERYLPYASKQVIVLSTDEEINGKYWELIKPHVNAVYTLVYDEHTRSSSIESGYFGGVSI